MTKESKKEQNMAYLASILLGLKAQSITSAAKSCGLNTSAVAGWLKGVPGRLSQEKQNILLGYLGVSGGTLGSDRVHLWTIDHSLEPLHEILAWSKGEFESVVLIDDSVLIQNFICLFDPLKSIRILVRQTTSPMVPASDLEFDRFFKCVRSRTIGEEIPTKQGKSLTSKELKEILARAEDWSVDSGVLREDIRTLIDHIKAQEGK